jgi:hypothetical protein
MAKLTLSDIANLENEVSVVATINANSALIETALENTLSRDGTSPNTMGASLDMNNSRIFNLPEPIDNTEPLRVIDAVDLAGLTVTPDTGASILAKLLLVDGAGSGLDADLLDGASSALFVKYADFSTLAVLNLDAGASGSAGTVDIFPTTAAKGKLALTAADNAGDTTSTIVNASQSAAATWTIPDTNGSASFVMTAATQTIGGAKTFSSAGIFSSTLGVTGALTGANSILSSHATAGVGYTTGAGGTVTQATSKSTTVVLNTITGTITMNNASLAAAAEVTFTLTNSAITSTDMVIVHHVSAGTAGGYVTQCSSVGSGTCTITVTNQSAGALAEAIVLRFMVLKSVDA